MLGKNNKYRYESVKTWSKKIKVTGGNVFLLDKVVIPVNLNQAHWCLCVAHVKLKVR